MNLFPSFLTQIFRKRRQHNAIEPDEIFLDSKNVGGFDVHQFEGRLEKPISRATIAVTGILFAVIALVFISQTLKLQIFQNENWRAKAENNRLNHSYIFAERGVIVDRNGELLAWNETDQNQSDYALRKYRQSAGTHNLLGYVKYPKKDKSGFYYTLDYKGVDGAEAYFNTLLEGEAGVKLTETDVKGNVTFESIRRPSKNGANIKLTIDVRLQEMLYSSIDELSRRSGFFGGAGMIIDITNGETLASVSYPEYDSGVMTAGTSTEIIKGYLTDRRKLFLDKVAQGVYTPGSIIKPMLAFAALNEDIIDPNKEIESTGELRVPNPYRAGEYTIFKDWRVNGFTDIRKAIAVSSDIYFYYIGGGFAGQKGLGIQKIDEYAQKFGFGVPITKGFFKGKSGVIPTPEWKADNFNGDIWRVGDTYNTSIGQYGFLVTPVQAVRATAAIANNGTVISPHIFKSLHNKDENGESVIPIHQKQISTYQEDIEPAFDVEIKDLKDMAIIREGMRMTVTDGTMSALNVPYVQMAGKTGTAQVGLSKQQINSWVIGFFPYEKPKYAFVLLLEQGPSTAMFGASPAMALFAEKVNLYAPEYFKSE